VIFLTVPSPVLHVTLLKRGERSLSLKWLPPSRANDKILDYQVEAVCSAIGGNPTQSPPITTQVCEVQQLRRRMLV